MEDPLAHLMLSVDGQRAAYLALHELAHEVCGGQVGGHRRRRATPLVEVVPRAWTHLLAIVAGDPLDPTPTPRWPGATTSGRPLGRHAPHRLTDGRTPAYRDWTQGYDPDTWLDRAILATRQEVFPLHGLDPMP